MNKKLLIPIVMLLALFGSLYFAAPSRPDSDDDDDHPSIVWSVESLEHDVLAGEIVTSTISLTARDELDDAFIVVVPAPSAEDNDENDDDDENPFFASDDVITVLPSGPFELDDDESIELDVTFTAPADTAFAIRERFIEVRDADRPERRIGNALPVTAFLLETPLPPDPGEAGNLTLEGIDADSDGVRDDIQRWIAFQTPDRIEIREALSLHAIATQQTVLSEDAAEASASFETVRHSLNCLWHLLGVNEASDLSETLEIQVSNTDERGRAFIRSGSLLGGSTWEVSLPTSSSCALLTQEGGAQ